MNKRLKTVTTLLLLSSSTLCMAQTKPTTSADVNLQKTVFTNALSLDDAATALQACHYIVAIQGNNSPYKDTMALLYHALGSYKQTILLGVGLLQAKPTNTSLLAIVADSYNKLGGVKEGITYQEKLYKQQPLAANGFTLMEMQMQLQRYAEVLGTANAVLGNKIDSNLVYNYKDTTGQNLQTPLKAAIFNMIGTAYYKQGNKKEAANFFKQALLVDDKFLVAKLNSEAVLKEEKK